MDQAMWTWVGAIGGASVGLLGGGFGVYCAIRGTQGPRERRFVIQAAILCFAVVLAFLAGLFLIPGWYRHLLWIPYAMVMGMGIGWCNRIQARLRREDAAEVPAPPV